MAIFFYLVFERFRHTAKWPLCDPAVRALKGERRGPLDAGQLYKKLRPMHFRRNFRLLRFAQSCR